MPDSKERKIIKYGETPEEPEELEELEEEEAAEDSEDVEEPEAAEVPEEDEETEAFDAPEVPDYFDEKGMPEIDDTVRLSREELDARIDVRRRQHKAKQNRKKRLTILIMVLAFALLATMCGKDIVRLKAENVALKRQQAALKKERDELKAELENTTEQEYIRDQAKKQLRLLNPGELLFIWDE